MFLRRSVYSINKVAFASTLPRVSTRTITHASKASNFSGYESHAEIEVGDLVTYVEAGNKTEGIVQKIFEESSKTNQKNPPHLAQIQNYYSRKVSYNDLSNLKSVARNSAAAKEFEKMNSNDAKPTTQSTSSTAKPAVSATNSTNKQTAHATSTTKSTTHETASTAAKSTTHAPSKPAASTATSNAAKTTAAPSNNKATSQTDNIEKQLKNEDSPLNADFAPGDIVRYRVAANFTAGVVQDIVYGIVHDEAGNFHGASHENPMARLENLWTKKITYHHLNVLEHVKRAKDVTPGRFAESEFEVYNNKQ